MRELKIMWQLLWSIPMCVGWLAVFAVLFIGWGPDRAGKFITYWNKMVDDTDFTLEIG